MRVYLRFDLNENSLLDSLLVECWLRVSPREVPHSSQGLRHTKIWDRKSFEVGDHWPLWRGWKNEWPHRTDKSRHAKKNKKWKLICGLWYFLNVQLSKNHLLIMDFYWICFTYFPSKYFSSVTLPLAVSRKRAPIHPLNRTISLVTVTPSNTTIQSNNLSFSSKIVRSSKNVCSWKKKSWSDSCDTCSINSVQLIKHGMALTIKDSLPISALRTFLDN